MSLDTDIPASAAAAPWNTPSFKRWRGFLIWQREVNLALRPHGLTQPQFAVLTVVAHLTEASTPVSQQAVASAAGLHRMHVSQILRGLETAGFLTRDTAASDARRRAIAVTAAGLQAVTVCTPLVEAVPVPTDDAARP